LEAIQKKGQKHKMLILWSKDLENLKQERKALETHELDQETQTPSGQSYQVQQLSLSRDQ